MSEFPVAPGWWKSSWDHCFGDSPDYRSGKGTRYWLKPRDGIKTPVLIQSDDLFNPLRGVPHREDGPAIIFGNGAWTWCKLGNPHREEGPAKLHPSYNKDGWVHQWWTKGYIHRLDGPSELITRKNGDREIHFYAWGTPVLHYLIRGGEILPYDNVNDFGIQLNLDGPNWFKTEVDHMIWLNLVEAHRS